MTTPDEPIVVFSVKEMLTSINDKMIEGFTSVNGKLDNKSDKSDVTRLETTLAHYGQRLEKVEEQQKVAEITQATQTEVKQSQSESKQRKWNFMFTAALALTAIIEVGIALLR